MDPRIDQVGLILTRDEADLAFKLDDAARAQEILNQVDESLRSTPIGIDLSQPTEEFLLDEVQTGRLWSVAFWATTQYLAGYKQVSEEHEYICKNDDIRRSAVAEYLFGLEIMMKLEAERYNAAKHFALEVDKTRDWSRSQVLSDNRISG